MQCDLFGTPVADLPDCVAYQANYMTENSAQKWHSFLQRRVTWQQPEIKVYGNYHRIPRLQCWMGELGYRYSGRFFEPEPWLPELEQLKEHVARQTGFKYNTCLLNWYRDGQDKMGWHADNEPELGPAPAIASISLGAVRPFQVKRVSDGRVWDIPMADGSLLLMKPGMQRDYVHGVPARKKTSDSRISLTFRQVNHS